MADPWSILSSCVLPGRNTVEDEAVLAYHELRAPQKGGRVEDTVIVPLRPLLRFPKSLRGRIRDSHLQELSGSFIHDPTNRAEGKLDNIFHSSRSQ